MLDVLADAQQLTSQTELLLDCLIGSDLSRGPVRSVEVPGVEAGEVLESAEKLVAADGRCDEFQVVGHRGVVDKGVGDHLRR